jgi:uncharacterized cupredoxin-like copper-binding protein
VPSKKMKIDFGGVDKEIRKGGGGGKRIPEGDYLLKILDSETKKSEKSGSKYITWKVQVADGEHKGVTLYGNTSLKADALWSLRNLIHAATGKNVAGKVVNFEPENIYGKLVGGEVTDNEYSKNGKTKITSQVNVFFPKDELGDRDEDEEEDEDEETEEDDDDDEVEDVEVDDI